MKTVEVKLWGTRIGWIGYSPEQTQISTFEYDPKFIQTGIQISPIKMKYPPTIHTFDDISMRTFRGVAGCFADSLPDKFGNSLIDIFMADKKIPQDKITTIDRLLYVGTKSMGALEYHPAEEFEEDNGMLLDIHSLSALAQLAVSKKENLALELQDAQTRADALKILRVGSSAGGARAKALVAQDKNGKLYDGTIDHGVDCKYWLLKFDIDHNKDKDNEDPKGMTRIEYIYGLIAKSCNINIPEISYIEDGNDFHFLIERFDRIKRESKIGKIIDKLHYVSWSGMAHYDRDTTGKYSYEQLAITIMELGLGQNDLEELFKRAIFNIIGRNQDDHTKNFGFLMDRNGKWSFSPAFDMTYAYDPFGKWTRVHQLKLNNKQDGFQMPDLQKFGTFCNLSNKKVNEIIKNIVHQFSKIETLGKEFGVSNNLLDTVVKNLRTDISHK
jgi:serine/threonine-protein kinase HipA